MNWLFYTVVVVLLIGALVGYRRGAIRIAVSLLAIIITLGVTFLLTPRVTDIVIEQTSADEWIEEKGQDVLESVLNESWQAKEDEDKEMTKQFQSQLIENAEVPQIIKDYFQRNNNPEVYTLLGAENFTDYITKSISRLIISLVVSVCIFAVVSLVIRLILYALDVVPVLPVIGTVNRLAGALFGTVAALLVIWLAFMLITVFCTAESGMKLMTMINENEFLSFLYNNNYVMKMVTGFLG